MAKKNESVMGMIKEGLGLFADVGLNAMIGNLRDAASGAMHDAQKQVEKATIKVLKTLTVFVIMILGFIMLIVGFGIYLSATVPALNNGLGTIVVGGGLLVLGLIVQFLKS